MVRNVVTNLIQAVDAPKTSFQKDNGPHLGTNLKGEQGHYIRPDPQVLATGSKANLNRALTTRNPEGYLLVMEDTTWDGLEKYHGEWLEEVVDITTLFQVDKLQRFVYARNSRRITIARSYFVAYAPCTPLLHWLMASRAFISSLHLQIEALQGEQYEAPRQQLSEHIRIETTYMMGLEGFVNKPNATDADRESNNYEARTFAIGEGWFLGPKRNAKSIPAFFNVREYDFVDIRAQMGPTRFKNLVLAYRGINELTPLEIGQAEAYCCEGVPAVERLPARLCANDPDVLEDEQPLQCRVGARLDVEHPFLNHWCCELCHRKMEVRELEFY